MRQIRVWLRLIVVLGAPSALMGAIELRLSDAAVGRNLQTFTTVALSEPAPEGGLEISLRSSDPALLLLSRTPLEKGSVTLTLKVRAGFRESPEFWYQGLADRGAATCLATGPGYADGLGTISLTPSAIIVLGPFRAPSFQTTTGASPVKLTLATARLDSSMNYVEEQLLSVAPSVNVQLQSSNKAAGTIATPSTPLTMGTSAATAEFQPSGEGETTLSVTASDGFSTPAQFASIVALVRLPGLALSDQLTIGQDLQVAGVLSLGAAAPAAGLTVTLTSGDPQQLLLSDAATKVGAGSLTITIPPGGASAKYYLQALAGSGTVNYKAVAKGFRERNASIRLAPAGVVLTPASQGPPDEAHVLRKDGAQDTSVASAGMKKGAKTPLVAWTVQLDPVTHRAADITVQPLRAGLVLKVALTNSEPGVGRVPSPLKIAGGSEHTIATFQSRRTGSTTISVETPPGFTTAANSTSVLAVVSTEGEAGNLVVAPPRAVKRRMFGPATPFNAQFE